MLRPSEPGPDPLVFGQRLLLCRMRQTFNSEVRRILEAHFDSALL
jgi:hypothetical protein